MEIVVTYAEVSWLDYLPAVFTGANLGLMTGWRWTLSQSPITLWNNRRSETLK